jgi:hypothetical protein
MDLKPAEIAAITAGEEHMCSVKTRIVIICGYNGIDFSGS